MADDAAAGLASALKDHGVYVTPGLLRVIHRAQGVLGDQLLAALDAVGAEVPASLVGCPFGDFVQHLAGGPEDQEQYARKRARKGQQDACKQDVPYDVTELTAMLEHVTRERDR